MNPPPTNPQNLVAMGGIEAAMLTWEGVPNPMTTAKLISILTVIIK